MCWSSQRLTNKPFLCGASARLPAVTCESARAHTCARTHTHSQAITDVTRIQEGVAAYYIPAAHTGCRARLGLFKRLRLDRQRGLWLLQPAHLISSLRVSVISGCRSVLNQKATSSHIPPSMHTHTHTHTHTKSPRLSLSWDSELDVRNAAATYLSFC